MQAKQFEIWLIENQKRKSDLADALGCSRSQISRYSDGNHWILDNGTGYYSIVRVVRKFKDNQFK